MVKVSVYTAQAKTQWDEFAARSKSGIFLFYRDYMEYHSDRFQDFSLLFYKDEKLIGIMPANCKEGTVYSHAGLTFGGIASDCKMKTPLMLEIFNSLKQFLQTHKINKLIYKPAPYIYNIIPAEEDRYALFLNEAALVRRDVSSSIFMKNAPSFSKRRDRSIKKSKNFNFTAQESSDYKSFMKIEEELLKEKYNTKPTHTAEELKLLSNRFPNQIKLFTVCEKEEIRGGCVIYEYPRVAHAQYIASTPEGRKKYALDFLFDYLIHHIYRDKEYFDFGISTEKEGKFLNIGLTVYKEEFGARAVVYDTYEWKIS